MSKTKVVVIGAGPAGLTAAYELLKENGNKKYDVVILEGENQVGGISKTIKYNFPKSIDYNQSILSW